MGPHGFQERNKMKKKDVIIEIRGVYAQEEDTDTIDFVTDGVYYKERNCFVIAYNESEMTGMAGCRTKLIVDGERCVTMSRTAPAKSQLIIERGVRHQCHYDTGVGPMTIGVCGDRISSALDEDGGELEFAYSLDINTALASENEVHVKVTPASPPGPSLLN